MLALSSHNMKEEKTMALFHFGKKNQEEKQTPTCACDSSAAEESCCCAKTETAESCCCAPATGTAGCCGASEMALVSSVKVLGSGCKSCHALLENTQQAVAAMGLGVRVDYVTDMQQIMAYGVMSMPALVVNEQVVSMGKVLKPADVEALLRKSCC